MNIFKNKTNLTAYMLITAYTFIILFWLSTNSYTHDLFDRVDSACFFMCGKSWMNGMTPYDDFADSKGPLLWLIYGIGYLISNNSYVGVFWIEFLFYVFTFIICFKLASLFLDKDKSIIAVMLLSFAVFHKKLHYETRAEDFCQLFIALGLYITFYISKFSKSISFSKIIKYSFILGLSFGALLMIKYNIAVMFGIFMLATLIYTRRSDIFKVIFAMALGTLAIVGPFFIYFIINGNLQDMLREYVFNTYDTVSPPLLDMLKYYVKEEIGGVVMFKRRHITIFCMLVLFSTLLFSFKYRQYKFMPFIFSMWFLLITIRNSIHQYYYNILPLFTLFGIVFILSYFKFKKIRFYYLAAFGVINAFILIYPYNRVYKRINFFTNETDRIGYYELSEIIATVPNPKLLVGYERGLGLNAVTTLPACRYWVRQNGATQAMIDDRDQCILNKEADFILYSTLDYCDYYKNTVFSSGYHVSYVWYRHSGEIIYLLSKNEIPIDYQKLRVPDTFDIFCKRDCN